jgi:hypothetical protein
MTKISFALEPFLLNNYIPAIYLPPEITLQGNIEREGERLIVDWQLKGDLKAIAIPPSSRFPQRENSLWEETCFEFFLGIQNSSQYWEFNLSPSGNWNVYKFKDYRQEMSEEKAFNNLPFQVNQTRDYLSINIELSLNKIINLASDLEIGIATVIKTKDDLVSYWALTHPGQQADFHRRDSFIINC